MNKKNDRVVRARQAKAVQPARACHGPEPERLKIAGDWKAAVATALRKPKPPGGWPK
ncbi:MAG: hypothetical protein ACLQM8_17800 [Limisphaerales bacterium]